MNCDLSQMICTGPELSGFDMKICTYCSQQVPAVMAPVCDPEYTLDPVTGMCQYQGAPPVPATTCPPGKWLDPVSGYCMPIVPIVDPACPEGYAYDASAQCCVIEYEEPSWGWPGIPAAEYSGCPVGYTYNQVTQNCVGTINLTGDWCVTESSNVGSCGGDHNGGCVEPGQYGDAASCQAAGCVWHDPATGAGGGYCDDH